MKQNRLKETKQGGSPSTQQRPERMCGGRRAGPIFKARLPRDQEAFCRTPEIWKKSSGETWKRRLRRGGEKQKLERRKRKIKGLKKKKGGGRNRKCKEHLYS